MSFIIGLFAKPRTLIAIVVLVLVLSAWVTFQRLGASLEETRAALADTREDLATAQAQIALNLHAISEAQTSITQDRVSHEAVAQAQSEIANAQDGHEFYVAWTSGIERVRNSANQTASA